MGMRYWRVLSYRSRRYSRSGEYDIPKTIEEAVTITESYIEQAYKRIERLFQKELARSNAQAALEARIDGLKKYQEHQFQDNSNIDDPDNAWWYEMKLEEYIDELRTQLQPPKKETHE